MPFALGCGDTPFHLHNPTISSTSTTTAKMLASGPKLPPVTHSGLSCNNGWNQRYVRRASRPADDGEHEPIAAPLL